MLRDYLRAALHRARYEILPEDGSFYGEVPGLDGVYSQAESLERCREELEEVIEEWIMFRLANSLDIPPIDGIELHVRKVG